MSKFMKKWWVEIDATDVDGQPVQFRGWFNTIHECQDKSEIPGAITGTMTLSRGPEGFHGRFDPDVDQSGFDHEIELVRSGLSGKDGNWLCGNWYVSPLSEEQKAEIFRSGNRMAAERILDEVIPIQPIVEEFTVDIQSHLHADKTYVVTM